MNSEVRTEQSYMKKVLFGIGVLLLSPVLLFLLLTVLLYVPSVQNWMVGQVTTRLSEATGKTVAVDHVCLSFPLDLQVEGALFMQPHDSVAGQQDTVAHVGRMVVDVPLRPLFDQRVVVRTLEIDRLTLNTAEYVAAARIKGYVHRLSLRSDGIDLKSELVGLQQVTVDSARLSVALCDSVPPDTSSTTTQWVIDADVLRLTRSQLHLSMPGDSLRMQIGLADTRITAPHVDLGRSLYQVRQLALTRCYFAMDQCPVPAVEGLDVHHLSLSDVSLTLDSIFLLMAPVVEVPSADTVTSSLPDLRQMFGGMTMRLVVTSGCMKEKSGLTVSDLHARMAVDSMGIHLPQLHLATPHSRLQASADIALSLFNHSDPGRLHAKLAASLGKADLSSWLQLVPPIAKDASMHRLLRAYPNQDLQFEAALEGNMNKIKLTDLLVSLPTAFRCEARGEMAYPLDEQKLQAQLRFGVKTQNLQFVTTLLPKELARQYRIPANMQLQGRVSGSRNHCQTQMTLHEGGGKVSLDGSLKMPAMAYRANLEVSRLNLHHFMPHDSLYTIDATARLSGCGTNPYSPRTSLQADVELKTLRYGHLDLDGVTATVSLDKGVARARLDSHTPLLDGQVALDALVNRRKVAASVSADVAHAKLDQLGLSKVPVTIAVCTQLDFASDLEDYYQLQGHVSDLTIRGEKQTWRPASLVIDALTRKDTTWAMAESGDFSLRMHAAGGFRRLGDQGQVLMDEVMNHIRKKVIDKEKIQALLPELSLHLASGPSNPIANYLRLQGVTFKELQLDMETSPDEGVNADGHLYSLVADSTRIDTVRFRLEPRGDELVYRAVVANNKKNPQFVFTALLEGTLLARGLQADMTYLDADSKVGARFGARAEMLDSGLQVHLQPYRPILGYKAFNLNEDNYIFMGADRKIQVNLRLIADDGTGVMAYSEDQDPQMLQDITVSLNKFDLEKITSVIPYAPRMSGLLNGDFHLLLDRQERLSMLSDLNVQKMTYEQCPMGNLGSEFVYLQREDSTHFVEARILQNDNQIGILKGSYRAEGEGWLDAVFSMEQLPLELVNGFVPDQLIGLEGTAEGQVDVKGPLSRPQINGEVFLQSSYLVSVPYGVRLRFDDDPVRVVNSKLLLENFTMYAYNDNPLTIYGEIDFSNLERMTIDMKMRAQNFQIIKAKKSRKSLTYGKAFVNFGGTMSGPVDRMKMRGQLEVLGNTDVTYILKDSPLSTDDQLKELVTFTDFRDTTAVKTTPPPVAGLDMLLLMNVEQGARVVCALNADESNYVNLEGGGELRMSYNTTDNLQLFGRYTLNRGEMKYELPVIPLKTFTIKEGSYIEFTGDIMNPRLNLAATEQVKALVGAETTGSRSVDFECGVKVTQTLNNMGLEFTLDAPDDMTIKNELAAMGVEQRGKLAVTMLTTGMYLADGNTSGFSMNSALNSFLQSEINNITKSAMRTVDLSLGLDQTADATGNTHTDYSFKFAKRFWNNRFNFVVGGKLSSGSSSATTANQDESFIDNVSLEYRLDKTAMKYVRLFYNKEAFDLLEGRVAEYGVGFVWRKKLESINELFAPKTYGIPQLLGKFLPIGEKKDSLQTDSLQREP